MNGIVLIVLAVILACVAIFALARKSSNAPSATGGTGARTGSAKRGGSQASKMVEDIKITQTSRVVDALSIVDELGGSAPGFRHYCELVGTSGSDAGLIAPYSKRHVAYYDIRCFRIERKGGQTVETLVAHERSIDPFYFTDGTTSEKVYVDLDTFGDDVILVNSTNHIEGPNSDFAKAVGRQAGSSGTRSAMACVAQTAERLANAFANVRDALAPHPALVLAGAAAGPAQVVASSASHGAADKPFALFAGPRGAGGGPGRPPSGARSRSGGRPPSGGRPRSGTRPRTGGSSRGGYGMPPGLGDFLGGSRSSLPYRRGGDFDDLAGAAVGFGLGVILGSLSDTSAQSAAQTGSNFQGYRLVEDVVPLGGPAYCIGELYRNGTQAHMSRSVSSEYPTSFFACKPEAEVVSALKTAQ